MLRKLTAAVLLIVMLAILGCSAHIHKVGAGATSNERMQERQWYVLWGLVPINNVQTHVMAGEAEDYEIKTEQSVLDFVINIFTGIVTVYSRTVTVTK